MHPRVHGGVWFLMEKLRVIMKDGFVVEYAPESVRRVELDVAETTWWLEMPTPLWWVGGSEGARLMGMSAPHSRRPVLLNEIGNSWFLSDLASGYSPKKEVSDG